MFDQHRQQETGPQHTASADVADATAPSPKGRTRAYFKFATLLLVAVLVGVGVWQTDFSMITSLQSLREWVQGFGPWAPLVFIAMYALGTIVFLPGSLFTIGAGVLFGPWLGTLYALVGASLGAMAAFALVRVFGADLAQQLLQTRFQRIRDYEGHLADRGFLTVLFLRLVPLFPFNGLNFVLGLTRVSWRDYVLATMLGILPGGFLYVLVGASLLTRDLANIGLALIAALAFGFVTYRFRRSIAKYVFKQ